VQAVVRSLLSATRQLETADACLPARCAGVLASKRVVLVYVPERAVVSGIDCQVGIIAPARIAGSLYSGAVDDRAFTQSHLA